MLDRLSTYKFEFRGYGSQDQTRACRREELPPGFLVCRVKHRELLRPPNASGLGIPVVHDIVDVALLKRRKSQPLWVHRRCISPAFSCRPCLLIPCCPFLPRLLPVCAYLSCLEWSGSLHSLRLVLASLVLSLARCDPRAPFAQV